MRADLTESSRLAVQGVVAGFHDARRTAVPLTVYPGPVPPDLETAYRCQDEAIDRWPDEVAGWKVARIGPAWSAKYPEERLIGPAFRANIHVAADGEAVECPVFEGGFAAVDAELVIRVASDAPPRKIDWSIEEASELIADLHIGIEVASSPLPTLNDLGPGAVISDFGNNWGVVVGPAVRGWRSLEEITVISQVEGVVVGERAASIRQGALAAFAFALGKAAQRGRPLRAGHVISTGMITGVHDIRVGQCSLHVFHGYGEVGCRATRAAAYRA
jgi:2-keto-4-pentenoate hydratase